MLTRVILVKSIAVKSESAFLEPGSDKKTTCRKQCQTQCGPVPGCTPKIYCCNGEEIEYEQKWTKVPRKARLDLVPDDNVTNSNTFAYEITCPITSGSLSCDACNVLKTATNVLAAAGGPFSVLFGFAFFATNTACESC